MFNCCEGLLVKVTARLSSDQQHRLQVHTVLVVLGRQCYTVRIWSVDVGLRPWEPRELFLQLIETSSTEDLLSCLLVLELVVLLKVVSLLWQHIITQKPTTNIVHPPPTVTVMTATCGRPSAMLDWSSPENETTIKTTPATKMLSPGRITVIIPGGMLYRQVKPPATTWRSASGLPDCERYISSVVFLFRAIASRDRFHDRTIQCILLCL